MKKFLIFSLLLIGIVYGTGRLYYYVTDGFSIDNITTTFVSSPRWEMHPLTATEQQSVDSILKQPFYYLGKGCQSYVFLSADGNYVIKFFKYQRYRPKPWVNWFAFLPFVESVRQATVQKKEKKLERVYASWKLAFDHLQKESGVMYAHLNPFPALDRKITIFDKMGFEYELALDSMQFLIQKKAVMVCEEIDALMQANKSTEVKLLLERLVEVMISEHSRGFVDEDHALMQNTGVIAGEPVHIDVGLFSKREDVIALSVSHEELFKKTYKFRIWLQSKYLDLATYLDQQLLQIIGESFLSMQYVEDQH